MAIYRVLQDIKHGFILCKTMARLRPDKVYQNDEKKVKFSVTLFCKSTSKYWYFYLPSISACSANIRANPLNRNEYHYLSGAFSGYYIKCPAGLQFREDRCRCDWPIMEAVENCSCCKSGVMKHETHRNMFKRLINGVWVDDNYIVARKHFTSGRSLGAGEMWMYHITGGSGIQLTERKNDQQDQQANQGPSHDRTGFKPRGLQQHQRESPDR